MDIRPLHDYITVVPHHSATFESSILHAPDIVAFNPRAPAYATLVACGPGRRDLELQRRVPTLNTDPLGWGAGDLVLVLKQFEQLPLWQLQDALLMLQDFDVLARVREGKLEPSYNRVLLKLPPERGASGRIPIFRVGRQRDEKTRMARGEVVATGPELHEERDGSSDPGAKDFVYRYRTRRFLGVRNSALAPGQHVLYNDFSAVKVTHGGHDWIIANRESVEAVTDGEGELS